MLSGASRRPTNRCCTREPAMEMHQVRYFLAVCDELNFTRAAEKCHVAQPSLTRAVKLLEEELGGPLFHRERANTHLSELGRMVKPYLDQVYAQTREAKRQALDFTKLRHTTLKLGVMCTIAPTHLLELLGSVQSRHPGIELRIIDDSANRLHERLIAGDLEVAIYCRPSAERDDWVLAMIAAGLGFGFMPEHTVSHPGVVARPLIEPEWWREVHLATVRGRPHSPAVGALVREAMRVRWMGGTALAVESVKEANRAQAGVGAAPA